MYNRDNFGGIMKIYNNRDDLLKTILLVECYSPIQEVAFNQKEIDSFYQELNPEELYLKKEEYIYLKQVISSLSLLEKTFLTLKYSYNYSNEEICSYLKMNEYQVGALKRRTLEKLKRMLTIDCQKKK